MTHANVTAQDVVTTTYLLAVDKNTAHALMHALNQVLCGDGPAVPPSFGPSLEDLRVRLDDVVSQQVKIVRSPLNPFPLAG